MHAEGVLAGWHARAASDPARIVLADLGDARADMAATRLGAEGLAIVIPPVLDRSIAAVAAGAAHAEARGLDPDDPVVAAARLVPVPYTHLTPPTNIEA